MTVFREPPPEVLAFAQPARPESQPPRAGERSLGDWLRLVLDGWRAGAAVLAVCVALGIVATMAQETRYQASGNVIVSPARGFLDPQDADGLPAVTDTVTRIATTPQVLTAVAELYAGATRDANLAAERRRVATVGWIARNLAVTQQANSSLIDVTGTASRQVDARDLTGAVLRAMTTAVNRPGAGEAGITLRLSPVADDGQVSPTPRRNLLIGINAGLILGVLTALGLGVARRRLWGAMRVADITKLPVVATLPRRASADAGNVALDEILREPSLSGDFGRVLLTGVESRGVVSVADRLSHRMATHHGRSVVVVDADPIRRSASKAVRLEHSQGLAELLAGEAQLDDVLVPGDADRAYGYAILPAGALPAQAAERMAATRLEEVLAELSLTHEYVFVCAPSLERTDEVARLLQAVDVGLLVVPDGVGAGALRPLKLFATSLRANFAGVIVLR